jgi:hypothetical protein
MSRQFSDPTAREAAMTRTHAIRLAPDEPRCNPQGPCSQASGCARRLAELPSTGAKLLSAMMPAPYSGACSHFVSAAELRKGAAVTQQREVKPWPGAAA